MKRTLFIITVVLAVALVFAVRYAARQKSERNRLSENQRTLLEEGREYRVRDSLNAATVGVLTMKVDEVRRGFEDMSALVRDMNVKLKRVESLSQTSLESRYRVETDVRDTVIVDRAGDRVSDIIAFRPARTIRFEDAYMRLDGLIMDSVFYGSVTTYDTLTQVVHRVPRRFLFFRWGTKELRQEIVSSNPHTHITYSRSVKITK